MQHQEKKCCFMWPKHKTCFDVNIKLRATLGNISSQSTWLTSSSDLNAVWHTSISPAGEQVRPSGSASPSADWCWGTVGSVNERSIVGHWVFTKLLTSYKRSCTKGQVEGNGVIYKAKHRHGVVLKPKIYISVKMVSSAGSTCRAWLHRLSSCRKQGQWNLQGLALIHPT